jgi:steroid delta-isomerase-like uncharacterized protein
MPSSKGWHARRMDTGAGERIASTFAAAVGSHHPAEWAAMFSEDAKYVIPDVPEPIQGRDALTALATTYFTAFPDMELEVRRVVHQGRIVVLEGATRGTFTGPMTTPEGAAPPTGRSFVAPLATIFELTDDGRIAESHEYYDPAFFAAQIGLGS